MERKTIVWFREEGDEADHLAYRDPRWGIDGRVADDATVEDLADLCDQEAEGDNDPSCGVHRLLASLVYRHAGRAAATAVLRDVAERGGLHVMNSRRHAEDAFADLGITPPWKAWELR